MGPAEVQIQPTWTKNRLLGQVPEESGFHHLLNGFALAGC